MILPDRRACANKDLENEPCLADRLTPSTEGHGCHGLKSSLTDRLGGARFAWLCPLVQDHHVSSIEKCMQCISCIQGWVANHTSHNLHYTGDNDNEPSKSQTTTYMTKQRLLETYANEWICTSALPSKIDGGRYFRLEHLLEKSSGPYLCLQSLKIKPRLNSTPNNQPSGGFLQMSSARERSLNLTAEQIQGPKNESESQFH